MHSWLRYDMAHCFLRDDANGIELHTISQAVKVPDEFVEKARERTPKDYPHTGFSITCGEMMKEMKPQLDDSDWHLAATGLSRQQLLHVAVRVLLGEYRRELTSKARSAANSLSAIAKA